MKNFALLACLLLLSCTSSKTTRETQIRFKVSNELNGLDTKFKILQVPSEILIGTIEQIESDDKYIYIFSSDSDNSAVYVFERHTGNYVRSIGHFGRGAEEYLSPSSISLNNDILSVIDEAQSTILNFNTNTFTFINKTTSPNIGGFVVNNSVIYANPYEIDGHHVKNAFVSLSDNFNVIHEYVKLPIVSGYVIGPSKPIYLYGDSVRAYTQFTPYVYELRQDCYEVIYSLLFDGLKFPEQSYLRRIAAGNKDYTIPLFKSDYISYFDVFETENNLLSMCIANNERYLGIYNKINNKGYLVSEEHLSQISPAQPFLISGVMDNMFIIPICISDMADSTLSIEMQSIIDQTDENDIVLQLIALK